MGKSPLILVADEEEPIRTLCRTKLEGAGFEVITATNGLEAFGLAKTRKPDLILMDVRMPVMDGIRALNEIREDPETKDIKVVFLTAIGGADPLAHAIHTGISKGFGALDYLPKSVGLKELVEKVRGYLDLK